MPLPSRLLRGADLDNVVVSRIRPPEISDAAGRGRLDDLYQELEIRLDRAQRLAQSATGGPADTVVGAGNQQALEEEVTALTQLLGRLAEEMQSPGAIRPEALQYLMGPKSTFPPSRALHELDRPPLYVD